MERQARLRIFSPTSSRWPNAAVALFVLLAGTWSSTASGSDAGVFAGPSDLVATMPDPYNIDLQWKNHATAEGGNLVEFQLHPEGAALPADERDQFLILGFLNLAQDTFRHEKLEGETVFSYRIHPYFGHCTEPAAITTGAAMENEPEEPEGPLEEPGRNPKSGGALTSIRAARTLVDATPAALTVSLSRATHVVLRWQDRAADADGYLVEFSRRADRDFQVCALLPPHTTSFRKTALPPGTLIYFRVRAFFYGSPSNSVTKTTGPDPLTSAGAKH